MCQYLSTDDKPQLSIIKGVVDLLWSDEETAKETQVHFNVLTYIVPVISNIVVGENTMLNEIDKVQTNHTVIHRSDLPPLNIY